MILPAFHNNRVVHIGISLLMACFSSGVAQDILDEKPLEMTLQEAVQIAVSDNPDIRSAYLDRVIQKFNLRVARDKFVPDVNVNGEVFRREGRFDVSGDSNTTETVRSKRTEGQAGAEVTEKLPTGAELRFGWQGDWYDYSSGEQEDQRRSTWTVSFTQPLLKGGGWDAATASVRLADLRERNNILQLKDTLISTVSQTIRAYRTFLLADRRVDLSFLSLDRARQNVEMNRHLIKAGRMAEVDIVQAESDVANQELAQQEVMNQRDRDRLALLNLLDLNSRIPLIPTETDDVRAITPDYEECLAVARLNRPDYLRAGHDLSAAEIQLDLAKNNRLWDLSLLADYRYSETDRDSSDSDEDEWSAGLRLSIPLYGDLTREQAVIAAQTAVRQAQLQVERLENELAIEVLDAVRDVSSRWARVRLASRARELAGRKLEIEQEKLRRGRSSNFEVVTFQNELTTAQNDEITSRIEYLNALTALDQVLGTTLDTWAIELRE